MFLSLRGLRIIVRNAFGVFPLNIFFLNFGRYVIKQVEGIQEPIAEDALRDDGGHVRAIDRILGGFRRHDLPGHEGMVQQARSCHSLSARLATDVQCDSSRQCQYKLFTALNPMTLTRSPNFTGFSFSSPMALLSGELGSFVRTRIGPY
jgi:hypothetical protein